MQCGVHYFVVQTMEDQITLRIPRELARALARQARRRGVPRSQLVREALRGYLAGGGVEQEPAAGTAERIAPFLGSLTLDRAAIERDALARRIRDQNWRD